MEATAATREAPPRRPSPDGVLDRDGGGASSSKRREEPRASSMPHHAGPAVPGEHDQIHVRRAETGDRAPRGSPSRRAAFVLRASPYGGPDGAGRRTRPPRARTVAPRAGASRPQEEDATALSCTMEGFAAAQRAHAVHGHRVQRIPLVDAAGEHRLHAPVVDASGRVDHRVERGGVFLCDRDVRAQELELERHLRRRGIGDRVRKVERGSRLGRLRQENVDELGERPRSGRPGAEGDPDPLGPLRQREAALPKGLEARDDRVLGAAIEAPRLQRRDLGLGAPGVDPRHALRLRVPALLGRHGADPGVAGEQAPNERGSVAPEGGDRSESGDDDGQAAFPPENSEKATTALLPPKANELESTARIRTGRAPSAT